MSRKKIILKNEREIELMIEGGRRLKKVVDQLIPLVRAGLKTREIDQIAEELIKNEGGEPSFKKVKGYFWSTCLSVNEQIVHTPPSDRRLKEGDILTIDLGFYFKGFHTDWATTISIGNSNPRNKNFLEAGEKTLKKAISQFQPGRRVGHISETIDQSLKKHGFFPIEELTGHGIGRDLHEEPYVPGVLYDSLEKTPLIENGMALAIEVIYSEKKTRIKYEDKEKWSLVTADGSLCACFEKTVAIYKNRPLILT